MDKIKFHPTLFLTKYFVPLTNVTFEKLNAFLMPHNVVWQYLNT